MRSSLKSQIYEQYWSYSRFVKNFQDLQKRKVHKSERKLERTDIVHSFFKKMSLCLTYLIYLLFKNFFPGVNHGEYEWQEPKSEDDM